MMYSGTLPVWTVVRRFDNPLSLEGEGWGEGEKGLIVSYLTSPMPLWIPAFAGMTD